MKPRVVGALFSIWARRRARAVEALAARADEEQAGTLAALVETARDTSFGEAHGFAGIRTHADFARNVPVRRYVEMLPWLERQLAGEQDVTWPGRARWFAKTSGTTAGDKAIPVTDALVAQNRKAGRDILAFHLRSFPGSRLFEGSLLFLGGSSSMEPAPAGGHVGDLSGIMAAEMPFWLRRKVVPSPTVVAIRDWEMKLEAIARETLGRDLTLLSGMPSWSLLLFERWRALSGVRAPAELFPGLELFVHGGVRYEPYRETVEEVEEAFVEACRATGVSAGEFTVAALPGSVTAGRPRLQWVVEAAGASFPFAEFALAADATLRRKNHDYDTKRTNDVGMLLPLVALVPPGTFHAWMRSRGKLGGQNKVPRLRNDREVADALIAAA